MFELRWVIHSFTGVPSPESSVYWGQVDCAITRWFEGHQVSAMAVAAQSRELEKIGAFGSIIGD